MRALGLDTRVFDTVGTRSVEANRDRSIEQLNEFFVAQPRATVVLVGASKGISELAADLLVHGPGLIAGNLMTPIVHAFVQGVPGSLANFKSLSTAS